MLVANGPEKLSIFIGALRSGGFFVKGETNDDYFLKPL